MDQLSPEQRVTWVVERLARNKASRPRREKSLRTSIHALCRKELTEAEVERIVKTMITKKIIERTSEGGIVYRI